MSLKKIHCIASLISLTVENANFSNSFYFCKINISYTILLPGVYINVSILLFIESVISILPFYQNSHATFSYDLVTSDMLSMNKVGVWFI